MHINFHTYRTIKRSLAQVLHTRRNSDQEQHLNTLALLICGIVGAHQVQFAHVAAQVPIRGRKNESLIGRFRRWVKHETIRPEALWLPFARAVLQGLASAPLTIVLDGSVAGRGCVVLIASVLYHGRAIPLLWTVVKGKKGDLPAASHCGLIRPLQEVLPSEATVVLLGDGEFDGIELQASKEPQAGSMSVAPPATSRSTRRSAASQWALCPWRVEKRSRSPMCRSHRRALGQFR